MPWHAQYSTRAAFDAATSPPDGATTDQWAAARVAALALVGTIPHVALENPDGRFLAEHSRDARGVNQHHIQAEVRIRLSGHAGQDGNEISVTVAQV
jgi:hypothetical protein